MVDRTVRRVAAQSTVSVVMDFGWRDEIQRQYDARNQSHRCRRSPWLTL
jgi:hypothetical protein